MKKRIITLLAIVAVMVACVVFAVQAETVEVHDNFKCPCSTCNGADTATWTALTDNKSLAAGGHYYVPADTTVTYTSAIGGAYEYVILVEKGGVLNTRDNRGFTWTGNAVAWLIGNGGTIQTGNTANDGALGQMGGAGTPYVHIGGDLIIKPKDTNTSFGNGLIKVYQGTLYVHDYGTAQNLSADTDPTFYAINSTSKTGIFFVQDTAKSPTIVLEAGTYNSNASSAGGSVRVGKGTLNLDGSATFVKNTNGTDDILLNYYSSAYVSQLNVDEEWSGNAWVRYSALTLTHGSGLPVMDWGTVDGKDFAPAEALESGTDTQSCGLTLSYPTHDNPPIFMWQGTEANGSSALVVGRVQLIEDGVCTGWYALPANAFNDYKESTATEKYIKIWRNSVGVTVTIDDLYVDLNGYTSGTWKIDSGKTLYMFDSTKTGVDATANVTTDGSGDLAPVTLINGNAYVVKDNVIYPVEATAELTEVTLRPGLAGMYFSAESTVTANPALDGMFYTGVAVSVNEITDTLDGTSWTATKGTEGNGMLVQNILKDGLEATAAANRAGQSLYAEACVTYYDGTNYHLIKLAKENVENLNLTKLVTEIAAVYDSLGTKKQYFYDFVDKWQKTYEGLWSGVELEPPATEA